ncbi:DISARM system SNF2-like helicase DrmD [Halomonas saccharevitans]|uniref:Superfamily II DNA or RNA helicase, SNF2 family n=1 Tax=Halomonas saccharevitans TaxID=416872 RepID=A0A1I7AY32_9GAMM|nr:DISARM system SNF2-like helicase DrmD [Halomonas saccharevitans]SFT79857.1 Superfamily II DNA or RNA helicase, SNF2 family [Halomonas saccharevitans]
MSEVTEATREVERVAGVPEPGQLVEVRRRQWVVADVVPSDIAGKRRAQHLVLLSSIEDDALGDELQVIWEIEPGAHIIERAGLPTITGLDDADTLEAFLDAVRWGAATNADRGYLQAPFRSGVSIEDFQLDPLVRAIDMARVNLLIADDVGLGKTIEAGLVIQELLLRHRARTVLVLCPASLQEKWRQEMQEKFGLEFRIVDTPYLKRLRREQGLHANPWTSFPRLIASMDWAKQGEGLRHLRDALPVHTSFPRRFDLLVVDEAHNVAPTVKHYAVDSLRTRLVRMLTPHFQHKLFLTATPHNGFTESFTALLELLDDQRFARNVEPDESRLASVMVRRLKSELVHPDGRPVYARRRLEALEVHYTPDEQRVRELLDRYIASRESGEAGDRSAQHFVHQLLKKRLASSTDAFASTLAKHVDTMEGRGGSGEERANRLDAGILRRAIARTEEDYADDGQRDAAEAEALIEVDRRSRPLDDEEREILRELMQWAQSNAHRTDSKATAIIDWLESHIRRDGAWSDERVILFTEYRDTQRWLQQVLSGHDFGAERMELIYGGMDTEEREKIKAAFQAHPSESPLRILLATDAASEGIDLQNHCSLMIHVEIPYNPNVMEQRNGRIDRHGQRADEVRIWHPIDANGNEGADILRALNKLDTMRADMGSVNPVIAPQLPALLEGRVRELDTQEAEVRANKSRHLIKSDRDLRERVAKLRERIEETRREQHFDAEHIERAVRTALRIAEKPDLEPTSLECVPEGKVFRLPRLSGSWAQGLEGLLHPFTKKPRPITFDHDVAKGRDDVVLVHLNHPLVQLSLRLLRRQVWDRGGSRRVHRVAVRTLPDDRLESPAMAVVSRLVITGGQHHRLHEELTEAGGYLRSNGFKREDRVTTIRTWLEEARPARVSEDHFQALRERFEQQRDAVMATVEARSRDRLQYLTNTLESRKRREIDDIQQVLDELRQVLEKELYGNGEPEQLDIFSDAEKHQLQVDRAALEARLNRLPSELEDEVGAIERHHSAPKDHTFPVAVVFLVPESLAKEVEA